MVDIGDKAISERAARAAGTIQLSPSAFALLRDGAHRKGDVLAVARIAAIMAAKRTAELIPLCHQVPLTNVEVLFQLDEAQAKVLCEATARCQARTGVEMEALTAVQIALLTIYDMCKAVDKSMVIGEVRLLEKRGGRSGDWCREDYQR